MATPKLKPDQVNQVSRLVAQYISSQREKYFSRAVPLSAQQKATLARFFSAQPLESTRLLVLQGERVGNPAFYPMLKDLGFKNLPDQSGMGAITFCDVVVSHEPFYDGLLFHEFVHVEQYRQLGIPRFSDDLGDSLRDALCRWLWQNTWTSRETHKETPPSAQECSFSGVLHSGSAEYSQRYEVIRFLGSASAAAPNRESLYRVARQRNKVVRSEQNPKNVRYPNSVPFVLKPTHEPFG